MTDMNKLRAQLNKLLTSVCHEPLNSLVAHEIEIMTGKIIYYSYVSDKEV